ncbi:MAG: hypoxanthine phosphoribosyltransferase [Chloroflexota bacterium]
MSGPPTTRLLISRRRISSAVKRLARQISADYQDKTPFIVGILTGSFVFIADLIRRLDIPLEVDFVQLSSYGIGTETSGKISVIKGLKSPVTGRHVLVVEDIVDTGLTVSYLLDILRRENPASLKVCALTDKPSRRRMPLNIDYLGFTVPDKFIVGYGIDWNNRYRYLPDICCVEFEE